MRTSDTDIFVGRNNCPVCGKRVSPSSQSGYWRVAPKTQEVQAWHLKCFLYRISRAISDS